MRRFIYIAILLCSSIIGSAQERYVSSQLAIGHLNQLDTYLSNEKYRGTQVEYISEVVRDSRKHPITFTLTHEGALSSTSNRADNGSMLGGHYDFSYAVMRKWGLFDYAAKDMESDIESTAHHKRLILRAGGFVNVDLGFAYNTQSVANNPAQGYLSANIGAQLMASYTFRLWKKDFRVHYEARIPFMGLMFSPNYGQTYYEIFTQGNYDHNVVFTSIATFQLRQQLALDVPVSKKVAVRLGYLGDIRQATPNNLKQHQWYNAAFIGVTITK